MLCRSMLDVVYEIREDECVYDVFIKRLTETNVGINVVAERRRAPDFILGFTSSGEKFLVAISLYHDDRATAPSEEPKERDTSESDSF